MPVYTYRARTVEGRLERGELNAIAEAHAIKQLESRGVYPVEVRESRRASGFFATLRHRISRRRINRDARILFVRQFEAMLRAGIPLTTALVAIGEQSDSPELGEVIAQVRGDIEGGSTLAQALRHQSALLSPIQISLVEAGEEGGILDEILARLGELLEWEAENIARIRQATFYPAMVITELSLAFVVIIRFVFPRFKALFAAHGANLPMPTRVMIGISDFVAHNGGWLVVALVALGVGAAVALRTHRGRSLFDRLTISAPIFGKIIVLIRMSQFARVMASLLESGIPFLRALAIVEKTINNVWIRSDISAMAAGIQKGLGIAESIPESGVFPPSIRHMLDVGEKSGRISGMLEKISVFYDRQADYRIKNLATVIEPILLVVLGASVMFVALAVFLPMWDMSHVLMGG